MNPVPPNPLPTPPPQAPDNATPQGNRNDEEHTDWVAVGKVTGVIAFAAGVLAILVGVGAGWAYAAIAAGAVLSLPAALGFSGTVFWCACRLAGVRISWLKALAVSIVANILGNLAGLLGVVIGPLAILAAFLVFVDSVKNALKLPFRRAMLIAFYYNSAQLIVFTAFLFYVVMPFIESHPVPGR